MRFKVKTTLLTLMLSVLPPVAAAEKTGSVDLEDYLNFAEPRGFVEDTVYKGESTKQLLISDTGFRDEVNRNVRFVADPRECRKNERDSNVTPQYLLIADFDREFSAFGDIDVHISGDSPSGSIVEIDREHGQVTFGFTDEESFDEFIMSDAPVKSISVDTSSDRYSKSFSVINSDFSYPETFNVSCLKG